MADGHDLACSDAANRCSDAVRLHIAMGSIGKWAAIKLEDGWSNGIPYDSRREAIAAQLLPRLYVYVKVPPDDMSPRHAERYLAVVRQLYDNGMDLADPETEVHTPTMTFDQLVKGNRHRDYLAHALRDLRR